VLAVDIAAYTIIEDIYIIPQYPAPERWSKEPSETDLLDGCILPTEKQVDMLLANRRSSRRGRRKRAAMYTHIQKWNVLSIPWKFDGKHSERNYYDIASNNIMLN